MYLAFIVAVPLAWFRGGHAERFGAGVLLFNELVMMNPAISWRIGDVYMDSAIADALMLVLFGWMTLRTRRWWPFAVTAALALNALVHILSMVTDIPRDAAVSARIGLWLLIALVLLAGVGERWLAGDAPVFRVDRKWTRQTV